MSPLDPHPTLRPYPEYKPSGVDWLGDIPAGWSVLKLKHALAIRNQRIDGLAANLPYLGLEHIESWSGRRVHTERQESESLVSEFSPGDLLFGKLRPYLAKLYLPEESGICSTEFLVLSPKCITARFAFWVMISKPFIDLVDSSTAGAKMPRANWDFIGSQPLPIPPLAEQRAIAAFLDTMDERVSRFIDTRRRMIALLEEQKQSIINQAVTKGLDPDVPMKPSGIDWLGDIPAHWEVRRLKDFAQIQTGLTLGKDYGEENLEERPYLRVANVQAGHLSLNSITTLRVPRSEIARTTLMHGDVLMTEGGDIDKLGRGAIWRNEIEGCLHQNHVFAVRPDSRKLIPDYLVQLMSSSIGRVYFQITAKQTTNLAATNSSTLKGFSFPLPSSGEQGAILEFIEHEVTIIKDLITRQLLEIELIQEYRTRLIADVVTGKLDVRQEIHQGVGG